jgi:hypothetical protein
MIPDDLKVLYERIINSHQKMGWKFALPLIERIGRVEANTIP